MASGEDLAASENQSFSAAQHMPVKAMVAPALKVLNIKKSKKCCPFGYTRRHASGI
jgi:hypothetical protein